MFIIPSCHGCPPSRGPVSEAGEHQSHAAAFVQESIAPLGQLGDAAVLDESGRLVRLARRRCHALLVLVIRHGITLPSSWAAGEGARAADWPESPSSGVNRSIGPPAVSARPSQATQACASKEPGLSAPPPRDPPITSRAAAPRRRRSRQRTRARARHVV